MSTIWKPAVTVAAVIERDGRFLLVHERTRDGLRLNQPAGHLDAGESLAAACRRETLEETAYDFTPTYLVGVYMWRSPEDETYVRFVFAGDLGALDPGRGLDAEIVRTFWLSEGELRARIAEHRNPMVIRCVDDFLRGQRYPLDLICTHGNVSVAT